MNCYIGRVVRIMGPQGVHDAGIPVWAVVLDVGDGLVRLGSLDDVQANLEPASGECSWDDVARVCYLVPLSSLTWLDLVGPDEVTPVMRAEADRLMRLVQNEHVHPYRGRPDEVPVGLMPSEDFGI